MHTQRTIGLDVECSKIPRHKPWIDGAFLVNVGIVDQTGWRKTWVFLHDDVEDINRDVCVKEMQEEINKSSRIVGHFLKFDLTWLNDLGIDYSHCKLWCTGIAEYLISGQKKQNYTLDAISKRRGMSPKIDRVKVYWNAGYETDEIPLHILNPYLEQDCFNALAIFQRQVKDVKDKGLNSIVALQQELCRVLTDIEWNGMSTNPDRIEQFIGELTEQLKVCEFELLDLLGENINLGSGDELSAALFGGILKHECTEHYVDTRNVKYKEPYTFRYKSGREVIKYRTRTLKELVVKTRKGVEERKIKGVGFKPAKNSELKKKGYYETNKDALMRMKGNNKRQKRIRILLEDRSKMAKALESLQGKGEGTGLLHKVRADGCIHGSFNQTVTSTGRLSSTSPNLQNQPRKKTSPIKKIFVPRYPGWVIGNGDLSQLEWRVAACLAHDQVAIKEILENQDYHRDNAIKFFGADPNLPNNHPDFEPHRTNAKVLGFRLLYGGTEWGMYLDAKMPNKKIEEWRKIVSDYWRKYWGIKNWQNRNIQHVYEHGFLKSPSGRILTFPPGKKGEEFLESAIKNYPVQSFATADIMPLAMVAIKRRMEQAGLKALMICQVHDSIVFDLPAEEVEELGTIVIETFQDLPRLIEQYWGYKFCVPLTGEFDYGQSYGELTETFKLAA